MTKQLNLLHLSLVTLFALLTGLFFRWQFKSDWYELAGYTTGIVGVYLVAVEHMINWPVGLANVAIYAWVFFKGSLFADMSLQVFFFVLGIAGWYQWACGGTGNTELQISKLRSNLWPLVLLGFAVGCAVYIPIIKHFNGALPYVDSVLTVLSIIAQLMLNRKVLENWLLWIFVDIVYIPVYISRNLYSTAFLYTVLLGLAVSGYVQWLRTHKLISTAT